MKWKRCVDLCVGWLLVELKGIESYPHDSLSFCYNVDTRLRRQSAVRPFDNCTSILRASRLDSRLASRCTLSRRPHESCWLGCLGNLIERFIPSSAGLSVDYLAFGYNRIFLTMAIDSASFRSHEIIMPLRVSRDDGQFTMLGVTLSGAWERRGVIWPTTPRVVGRPSSAIRSLYLLSRKDIILRSMFAKWEGSVFFRSDASGHPDLISWPPASPCNHLSFILFTFSGSAWCYLLAYLA